MEHDVPTSGRGHHDEDDHQRCEKGPVGARACDVGRKSGVHLQRQIRHEEAGDNIGEENALYKAVRMHSFISFQNFEIARLQPLLDVPVFRMSGYNRFIAFLLLLLFF